MRIGPSLTSLLASAVAIAALSGCAASEEDVDEDGWSTEGCSDGKCDGAGNVAPFAAPDLLVTDLGILGQLETAGFDLASQLGGTGATTAAINSSSPRFAQVAQTIDADIAAIKAEDRASGVGIAYGHRLFDARWLRSANAKFRLVAVVNRLDRMTDVPGTCGETRFIYRLTYSTPQGSSRLPMTFLVSRPNAGSDCSAVARAWKGATASAMKMQLGPLAQIGAPDRIEINLQSVRWPSSVREDLGGHAEYLLRVFSVNATQVAPQLLDNTIKSDLTAAQKTSLAQWISTNAAAIDMGTAQVPDEYLATKVRSVSPRGLARGANRPFLLAFPRPEQTFASVNYGNLQLVKSPGGLIRRLDTMSCEGCHQTRGVAGFHLLGQEDAAATETDRGNQIEVGTSPHLQEQMRWRRMVNEDVAAHGSTVAKRPFADRDAQSAGKYGAHCGLGDPSFASWTCAQGFVCKDLSGEEVGMCEPEKLSAGDACETSSVSFDANPHADRVTEIETSSCTVPSGRAARCSKSSGGFPNGLCSASCTTMGAVGGDAICGQTPPSGFNDCIGQRKPFAECLANAPKAFRRRCDAANPCGDDYVCAGVPGAPKGVGACMPPYFIFEARVDGHPSI